MSRYFSCLDKGSTWRQISNVFLLFKLLQQFHSGVLSAQFLSQTTWNNREMFAKHRRFSRRCFGLSSL